MNSDDYLFVYGTLRRGAIRTDAAARAFTQLEADASFMGLATMDGRLFEVDGYPGGCYQFAVGSHVTGDLYQVDVAAGLFSALDAYEESDFHFEQPREYQRQRVPVALGDGSVIYAWVYLYSCSIDALLTIESGDYLLWQRQNEKLLGDIKLDQNSRFLNGLMGKLLFWLIVLLVVAMAGFWFFGHTEFLSHIDVMDWRSMLER